MLLFGCFLMLLIFFLSGISKVKNFKNTVNKFKKVFWIKGLPNFLYNLTIIAVIILEILPPLIIMYNLQTHSLPLLSYYSVLSLIIFTIMATLLYHFPTKKGEYYYFMKNLSIIGGLIMLLSIV